MLADLKETSRVLQERKLKIDTIIQALEAEEVAEEEETEEEETDEGAGSEDEGSGAEESDGSLGF
ncbi:hypothetical protein A2U01_0087682 [Trifolium medium]|uniref:Uncharacterized protein n=1 Tax=Trifolium medium TaxID=97028 RepID=A0A392U148_9FABA|nr:hypothetical protein [Trifolium medium]